MPDWKDFYEAAMAEPDKEILKRKLLQAENAILARLGELEQEPEACAERQEITSALEFMLAVREQRLGWPTRH